MKKFFFKKTNNPLLEGFILGMKACFNALIILCACVGLISLFFYAMHLFFKTIN